MCPDDDTIVEMLEGRLDDGARTAVLAHLDGCDRCRRLVADAGALGDDEVEAPDEPLGRGSMIGRHVVTRVVGAGAMGVVYAAHDPQLERDVAIKRLRAEAIGDRSAEDARAILLREARTIAQLEHPNVVTVYDADVDAGGRVYLVMELVVGRTLRAWLAEAPRSWRELRDVFVQAGHGLAAAHAAGVIHRDVKPDNLLVGDDGRVRVTDFGLARGGGAPAGSAPRAALRSMTSLAGTPAYMAPEQLAGLPIDERADLFAFCVALYEALYGARPFDGRRREGTAGAAAALPPVIAPPRAGMPARARRALERGLRADRDQRPPTMAALLAELEHRPRLTAPRLATGALALGALTAAVIVMRPHAHAAPSCTGADAAWGTLWSPAQRDALHAAFRATGRPIADDSFAQTDAAIVDFGRRWRALHTDACRAHLRGEQSAAVLDRRMACLAARHRQAETVIAALQNDVGHWDNVLGDAPALVHDMSPLDDCADARGDDVTSTRLGRAHAPVARLDRDGHLEVFALDGAGQPWRIAQATGGEQPAWGAWARVADPIAAQALAVTAAGNGRLDVFVVDGAGAIRATEVGMAATWQRLGGVGVTALSVVTDGAGREHVFAIERGALIHLGQVQPNSGWGEWTTLREHVERVVAITDDAGAVHVGFTADGRIWHGGYDAGGAWRAIAIGDLAARALAAGVDFDGRLELIAIDGTNRVQHAWVTAAGADPAVAASWSAWAPLGKPDEIVAIHVNRNAIAEHGLQVFGETPAGALILLYQAGATRRWNGWWEDVAVDPQMGKVDGLALAPDAEGRLYIVAAATTGALWMRWQSFTAGGALHGWLVL